jgi:hypothetical protein
MSKPDSSIEATAAPGRVALSLPRGPVLLDPGLDTRLVALDSAAGRLLRREPQAVQQAADMRGVIAHLLERNGLLGHKRRPADGLSVREWPAADDPGERRGAGIVQPGDLQLPEPDADDIGLKRRQCDRLGAG